MYLHGITTANKLIISQLFIVTMNRPTAVANHTHTTETTVSATFGASVHKLAPYQHPSPQSGRLLNIDKTAK